MKEFTHFDEKGNAAMVDVSGKSETARQAVAAGRIRMTPECRDAVRRGTAQKGDVLGVARVAGIMAAKQTSSLIPLCHPLPLSKISLDFAFLDESCEIEARCTAKCAGVTGVEMEALTGASVALLTIYDMCKAMDKGMEINAVRLLEKSGGKSGLWRRGE